MAQAPLLLEVDQASAIEEETGLDDQATIQELEPDASIQQPDDPAAIEELGHDDQATVEEPKPDASVQQPDDQAVTKLYIYIMAQAPLLLEVDQAGRDAQATIQEHKPDASIQQQSDDPAAIEELGHDDQATVEELEPDDQAATKREYLVRFYRPLHNAASAGNWENAERFLIENPNADITHPKLNGKTILHLAAKMGHADFIKKLVQSGRFPKAAMKRLDKFGWPALHYAATIGSLDAVKVFVSEDNSLTQVLDSRGLIALHQAATYTAEKRVLWYLAKKTTNDDPAGGPGPLSGVRGASVILRFTGTHHYDISLYLLNRYPQTADYLLKDLYPDMLGVLARTPDKFPSGSTLSFWERCIYPFIPIETPVSIRSDLGGPQLQKFSTVRSKLVPVIHWIFGAASKVIVFVPTLKHIRDVKYQHKCIMQLLKVVVETMLSWSTDDIKTYLYTRPTIYSAAENGVIEIIRALFKHAPDYMDNRDAEVDILLWAIENRREHVFNLMMERGVTVKLLPHYAYGSKKETILHVAAKLAPYARLTAVSSPALQMQRELQWFQGVERFVHIGMKPYINLTSQTAQELFTMEHMKLAKDAEKWLKDTASSGLVVATLILTVVFAAAFTFPGGIIDGTGIALFLNQSDFMVFIVSDAVGMFSSTTSILMFLSIHTARYAEQDFLRALPKRLILGLVSLLIALASMMVAFGVALYMILKPKFKWVVFPIIGLTSIPVGLFILLQLPLIVFMIRSTYGPSILKPLNTVSPMKTKTGPYWVKLCHVMEDMHVPLFKFFP